MQTHDDDDGDTDERCDLPDEHVNSGDAHVSVDRLPRLDETVQLAVGQRTALVDPQTSL